WSWGSGAPAQGASASTEQGGSADAAERREINRLAQQGREALQAGEYRRAAHRFERALDLDAQRGVLWQNLATVRHKQGRYRRAEQLALHAAELAGSDPTLLRESWWLVAAARLEQGDRQGAEEAAQMARRFEDAGGPRVGALPPEQ
ncbi:tetratricopeptide repeat protein, partial [Halorhodospira neutriphila]